MANPRPFNTLAVRQRFKRNTRSRLSYTFFQSARFCSTRQNCVMDTRRFSFLTGWPDWPDPWKRRQVRWWSDCGSMTCGFQNKNWMQGCNKSVNPKTSKREDETRKCVKDSHLSGKKIYYPCQKKSSWSNITVLKKIMQLKASVCGMVVSMFCHRNRI